MPSLRPDLRPVLTATLALTLAVGAGLLTGCGGCGTPTDGGGGGGSSVDLPDCEPNTPIPDATTLTAIAATGDAVPGQSGATFTFFGTPIIDADGRIAFWAGYAGGDGDAGIFVWDGQALTAVITDDENATGVVPGRSGEAHFDDAAIAVDSGAAALAWGPGGELLFVAAIRDGSTASRGVYRWRATDGDLARIVDGEQQSAEYDDDVEGAFDADYLCVGISDAGAAPYLSEYTYITQDSGFVLDRRALFVRDNGDQTRIADANPNDAVATKPPDKDSSARFTSVGELFSLNPAGAVLFQGQYASDVATAGDRGVYALVGDRLVRVIDNRTNGSWPGLQLGTVINSAGAAFEALSVGVDLRLAIATTVTRNDVTRNTVLYWDTANWREIALGANYATNLLSGVSACGAVLVLIDGEPCLFAGGSARNLAALTNQAVATDATWLGFGGAINNSGRGLLRYRRDSEDAPGLAFWTGEEVLIVVDDLAGRLDGVVDIRTVEATELDRPGRSGALNDRDQFVFRASLAGDDDSVGTDDDVQTIYLGEAD